MKPYSKVGIVRSIVPYKNKYRQACSGYGSNERLFKWKEIGTRAYYKQNW